MKSEDEVRRSFGSVLMKAVAAHRAGSGGIFDLDDELNKSCPTWDKQGDKELSVAYTIAGEFLDQSGHGNFEFHYPMVELQSILESIAIALQSGRAVENPRLSQYLDARRERIKNSWVRRLSHIWGRFFQKASIRFAQEIFCQLLAAALASIFGLLLWSLKSSDFEIFSWGIIIFFPWLVPLKTIGFYPVLKWHIKSHHAVPTPLLFLAGGALFGFFEIIALYWAAIFGGYSLSFFLAEFLSQAAIALFGVSIIIRLRSRNESRPL